MKSKSKKRRDVPVAAGKSLATLAQQGQFQAACDFWRAGDFQQAAGAFQQLLDLPGEDPHYSRYWLSSCLFQLGATDELGKLLQDRDDGSGLWRFAQALQAFRLSGDKDNAQMLLLEANRLEPGFERYLLGESVVDARHEPRFDAGSTAVSHGCARLFLPAWRATPGAATWARRVLKIPPGPLATEGGSHRLPLEDLLALPQQNETWQLGLAPQGNEPGSQRVSIWLFGVANTIGREVRAATVIDQPLTPAVAWNAILEAFLRPLDGEPARPTTLVVCRKEFSDAWKPLLEKIGIRCRFHRDPQPVGRLLQGMSGIIEKSLAPPSEQIDVRQFPQSDEVWQVDFLRSPTWIRNEREGSYRPWMAMVLEKSKSHALATPLILGEPMPELLLEKLAQAMARPAKGTARRPLMVELSDSDCFDHLRPRLDAVGVACRLVDEIREFNEFCLRLAKSVDSSQKCSLAGGQGVTRAHLESFFEAAAYYFKRAPWRSVPGEAPIEIACDELNLGGRVAIVLGRTGVQLGLCVYDDWNMARSMLGGYAQTEDMSALVVCYDESEIMAAVDLQLVERLGWPIATPEAWPAAMRLLPRRSPKSPAAAELVFLDACLRAIPDLLDTEETVQVRQVETGTRKVELSLRRDWT